MMKKLTANGDAPTAKRLIILLVSCAVSAVLASLCNTLALYVDSKLFGYYDPYMVFGVLVMRIAINGTVSCILGYISLPVIMALRKAKLL